MKPTKTVKKPIETGVTLLFRYFDLAGRMILSGFQSADLHAFIGHLTRKCTHILSFLPTIEVISRGNANRDALVHNMEEKFTRAQFLQKAEEMGIKVETASTWLKRLLKHGLVESVDKNGNYQKPFTPLTLRFTALPVHSYLSKLFSMSFNERHSLLAVCSSEENNKAN